MEGPQLRTLQRALAYVGTKERLAVALNISLAELERYFSGEPMPQKVFLDALDIVAGRPDKR